MRRRESKIRKHDNEKDQPKMRKKYFYFDCDICAHKWRSEDIEDKCPRCGNNITGFSEEKPK